MFLAGADQNKPELRVPSLRGELRWWLRALLGGYLGTDPNKVSEWESKIFGDAGENGQSKFTIKVRCDSFNPQREPALPHKQDEQQKAKFQCIPVGTNFSVMFQSLSASEAEWKVCCSVFELLSLLGGLGRRSRRAFGNFHPASWSFENADSVRNFVREKVQNSRSVVQEWLEKQPTSLTIPTSYPILSKDSAEIRIAESTDWKKFIKSLMDEISNELKSRNLHSKVLGGIRPRQASTMIVSVVKLKNGNIVPIFTNFFCDTASRPIQSDFNNIQNFPTAKFKATLLQV